MRRGKMENIGDNKKEVPQEGAAVLSVHVEAGLSAGELAKRKIFARTPDSFRVPEEDVLETGQQERAEGLRGGNHSNEVIYVKIRDDGSAIFKPKDGEYDFSRSSGAEKGTLYMRERAAYLVDRFLGFKLVPPTTIREIDGRIGSAQQFIPDTRSFYEISGEEREVYDDELNRLWFLDYLIWNMDRHGNNLLAGETPEGNRSIHAIDNGLSFSGKRDSGSISHYLHKPVPSDVSEKVRAIIHDSEKKELLRELLTELLPKNDVEAFFARVEVLGRELSEHQEDADYVPRRQNFYDYHPGTADTNK